MCLCVALLCCVFFFNDTATTEIYTLSLHDALPISGAVTSGGAMDLTPANPSVWALLLSFAVAVKTRSLILTMVVGGIVMYLGQVLLG